jgi:hypothetical protein
MAPTFAAEPAATPPAPVAPAGCETVDEVVGRAGSDFISRASADGTALPVAFIAALARIDISALGDVIRMVTPVTGNLVFTETVQK